MAHIQPFKRAWHEDLDVMPRNSREYHNFTVGDHARVIAGDVHYNTVNHRDIILDSLHFPGMERYHDRPLENHPGTFDWLFDQRLQLHVCDFEDHWRPGRCDSGQECHQVEAELHRHASKLQTWLETSNDIFWVQGKAGSGKSTFMKFLFEHQQTQVHLQRWAGGDVIAAAFFFWRAGSSELEKSYLGLLRGLLYQVLQERRELIELILPQRWSAVVRSATYKRPWTKSELVSAFDLLLQTPETNSRFCFFIDGLDEFDGDHHDLIDAIRSLGKSPCIKICVSSRPWDSFQREFGSDERLHIALHTLTKRDIDTYVVTKLETAARPAADTYCAFDLRQLANAVCRRSEGVFLWVALAVKDLRRGIEGQDSLRVLHVRLENYPSELRDFVQHIFDTIDPTYKMFAARLLLVMLENTGPPALISLHFLEEAFTASGEYILDPRWTPKTDTEMYRLIDRAAVCANNWCRDLLQPVDSREVKEEISDTIHYEELSLWRPLGPTLPFYTRDLESQDFVSYLSFGHRSIHQFAEEKAGFGTLLDMAGPNFDCRLAWLCAFVELSRCAPDLFNFIEVFQFASRLLLSQSEHQLLTISEEDESLAHGIQRCLEAFDLIGQNIETSSTYNHWTAARLVDEKCSNLPLCRRMPTGSDSECSSFASCLVYLFFPDFIISPILTRKSESLTELQKQFVLEDSLMPFPYRGGVFENILYTGNAFCRLGHPAHYHNVIVQVIRSGIDVNRPTQRVNCRQDYSVWQFFLLWLHDYFHERPDFLRAQRGSHDHEWCRPEDELSLIKDTTKIFRVFLQHGADPFAVISSVDLMECYERDATLNKATFLSVADVVKDVRDAAAWQLANYDDPHAWLAARHEVVDDFEKLLDETYAQRYLASTHATALSATTHSSHWPQS